MIGAILSRLLKPEEFGIVAMVLVFTGFFSIFNDAGIKSFIIQHPNLTKADSSFVFYIGICLGGTFTLILFLAAPYVEEFYQFKGLTDVTRVLSLQFLISSIGFVPRGIIERNLKFKISGMIELSSSIVGGVIGVILAFMNFSYWALVYRSLVTYILMAILLFIYSKWRPIFKIRSIEFKRFLNYSGNLTLFGIINYWARNFDNLLVGKYLGSSSLGFYNRAYSLMTYPITLFSSVINPVLHPIFSRVQTDITQIRQNYLKVLKLLAIISFPFMTFLTINAESVITIVWGGQWKESVPIFRILGVASLFQPILNTTGSIFLVRNKTDWLFRVGIINTLLIILGFIVGLKYGLLGVSAGYTAAFFIMLIPTLYIVFNKLLQGSLSEFFDNILVALYMVIIISISNILVIYFVNNLYFSLLINTIISSIIFLIIIRYYEKLLFWKLKNYLRNYFVKILSTRNS